MARTGHNRIPLAAKLAPPVIVAGTLLGWLLGSAANPVMKQVAEPWRQPATQGESASTSSNAEWPDFTTQKFRTDGGYRPDLDYNAVAGEEWALPDPGIEPNSPSPAPIDEAFDAANKAGQAAEDAREAASPPADEPQAEEPDARKSRLVQSGLY